MNVKYFIKLAFKNPKAFAETLSLRYVKCFLYL